MKIQGKLHRKFDTKQITDTFRKREFVIEYVDNPQYPQYISFQLIQNSCDLIEPYQQGTMLEVEFNLRGREWTSPQGETKYFNSLDAWRINAVQQQQGASPSTPTPPPDVLDVTKMDDDDLPF